ncbi:helix-turn-helix domain-containing protein [Nonomuraea sp. NPDC003754]
MATTEAIVEARKALAGRLKELRISSRADGQKLTGERLAELMGWSGRKARISKIENGIQLPTEDDIRAWARACGAEEQIPDLIAAARHIDSLYTEWRRLEKTGLGQIQEAFLSLYERTTQLRVWQHSAIPGLLQTREYAHAHLATIINFRGIPDDIERAVTARLAQQETLGGTRRFMFLLGEQALRTPMLEPAGMAAQLDKLATYTHDNPNVSLGILPATTRPPVMPPENFWLYDSDQVRVDALAAQFRIKKPDDIAVYEKAFSALAEACVYGQSAHALIDAARQDL